MALVSGEDATHICCGFSLSYISLETPLQTYSEFCLQVILSPVKLIMEINYHRRIPQRHKSV